MGGYGGSGKNSLRQCVLPDFWFLRRVCCLARCMAGFQNIIFIRIIILFGHLAGIFSFAGFLFYIKRTGN